MKSLKATKKDCKDMLMIFSACSSCLSEIFDLINDDDLKSSDEEDLDRFKATKQGILDEDDFKSSSLTRSKISERQLLQAKKDFKGILNVAVHVVALQPNEQYVEYFSIVNEIIHWMKQFSIALPSSAARRTIHLQRLLLLHHQRCWMVNKAHRSNQIWTWLWTMSA